MSKLGAIISIVGLSALQLGSRVLAMIGAIGDCPWKGAGPEQCTLSDVLAFPLGTLGLEIFKGSDAWALAVFSANSLIWGIAGYALIRLLMWLMPKHPD